MLRRAGVLGVVLALVFATCAAGELAGDTPAAFAVRRESFDFLKREVMIPMRDGVRLRTFILVPRGAKQAPILLDRTPYNAKARTSRTESPHLASVVPQMLDSAVAAGYIIVYQDVRGKYGSEGEYVMNRPLRGPLNPTSVDHSTDAYDTIEWLVNNVPESNGRVGTIGGSYEGFTAVLSTVHPHPALKIAVPFAPMVDGWTGDDWFHHGAFRQDANLSYIYAQEATRGKELKWWSGTRDTYEEALKSGSADALARSRGMEQLGFWRTVRDHPAFDAYWQNQALDRVLAGEPPHVPMVIVSGLFDQEDIYGGPALFAALAPLDPQGKLIHLVMGPWSHHGGREQGRSLGPFEFAGDTAVWFRAQVLQPLLDHYLKDGPEVDVRRVLAYETGANVWHQYSQWPQSCAQGCPGRARDLFVGAGGSLSFDAPSTARQAAAYDEYLSDPGKPVPYRQRPTLGQDDLASTWEQWLADDQRNAAARPDVLVYETEPLTAPLRVAGVPVADLYASTSGTDSDWVVKLIDVWPDQVVDHPELGGYQQMISADILRGRYADDPAHPHALRANEVTLFRLPLPNVSHTFLPGHRVMMQVQSSWFPLYDRNPQVFVPNIMTAKREDYRVATQRVWRAAGRATRVELPVVN